ncbi:MAG: DUF2779 domain-containing protein, partial [Nanoarchaeota archaeon]
MKQALLSKSSYMIGLQCPRYLWTKIHEKEKIPEASEADEWKFEQGYLIQEYAQKWFLDGIDIDTEDFNENLKKTAELINLKQRKPLFEAAFKVEFSKANYIYSRADILVPVGKDLWDIVEVKSSASLKPENIQDIAFQKYVLEKAGLKIRKCFLMCVNNEYVKHEKIDCKKLMKTEDISEKIEKEIKGIEERIENLFKIINAEKCPKIAIGNHCKHPYECPLTSCWDFIPGESVFELYYGGKKSFELFEKDIKLLKDIPIAHLTKEQQKIQVQCAKTNKPYINKEKIKEFLDKLIYPVYYLDFETIGTAIPLFDGSHPYQNIAFQYSLHIQESRDSEAKHVSFLAKGDKDPRHEFIKSLKENLGNKGSIVTYNQAFEKSVLEKLEMICPKEKKWIENIIKRLVDLLQPFRNFDYYNPKQKGSASIKSVMPSLVPKLPKGIKSYDEMEIDKGDVASMAFLKIALGECPEDDFKKFCKVSKADQEKTRKMLEEYCELDTLAEVMIVKRLKE